MFKKVIYNTGAQIVAKGISASTTLIITLIIGRTLGPAGFGDFTKIFVFVGYFYTIVDFGLNSIYVKKSQKNENSSLFNILIGLRILLALSLVAIAILISFFLPYNSLDGTGFSPLVKTGIIIASITIVTHALFTTANGYFQKKLKYDLSAIATTLGSIVIFTIIVIFSFISQSLYPFVAAYVIGGLTYVATSFYLISSKFKQNITPQFNKNESLIFLKTSFPIGVALILNLIYFRIDVLILSSVRSSAEVGIYGLGYQFFQAGLAIPIFFSNSLFPLLSKLYLENIGEFRKQIKKWSFYLILFSIALMVLMFLVSYLIPILYDSRFLDSGLALRILSIGLPLFFLSALLWHMLIIYGKQKLLIYIYAIGAVLNIALNIVFIPIYGYIAASIITVVSEAIILLLSFASVKFIEKGIKHA